MAEITEFKTSSIKTLLGDLTQYRYNPGLIQRRILDHLADITDGKIDIVDPTNPFIYLLEASCVNTALANQEAVMLMRKRYPALSQTQEDLYLHMSDWDYLDRFATPVSVEFYVYIELTSLMANLVDVPNSDHHKLTIARNTEVTVDDNTFALQYPVDIIKYDTGVLQIKYNTEITSPLQSLTTNMIDYSIKTDANNTQWLVFKLPLTQFYVTSVEFPVQKSRPFIEEISLGDQYYVARVYYRRSLTTGWTEIKTTHTDQVYDPYVPTAVITVFDKSIKVFIPPSYIHNELITGTVRIDVYNTHGKIDKNFSNYDLKSYTTDLKALDEITDITPYTNAMQQTTFFCYTDKTVSGGRNALTLNELREAVILNSLGDRTLPITPAQIEYYVDRKGFELYKNIDVITDRIFVATRNIPISANRHPVTPVLVTIAQLIETTTRLTDLPNIKTTNSRMTILSNTVMELIDDKLVILDNSQLDYLDTLNTSALLKEINTRQLVSNPYHYVLDFTKNELHVRPYSLDYPIISDVNFLYQNPSLQLTINTDQFHISRTDFGYRIQLSTKSGKYYKEIPDAEVGVQLAFQSPGEMHYGYLNGRYVGRNDLDERVFEFDIHTEFDVDNEHRLYLTNFEMASNSTINLPTPLKHTFQVLHHTQSLIPGYQASVTDEMLGSFMLEAIHAVITHEQIDIQFGLSLDNLWCHYRSSLAADNYRTYTADIPMVYSDDVYETDPATGSIFIPDGEGQLRMTLLHRKGDVVYDIDGQVVYQHRVGDVILDAQGNPEIIDTGRSICYIDLLLIDYKHIVANRPDHNAYYDGVIKTLDQWITYDLKDLDKILLEQTNIYFKPKKTIGNVLVTIKDGIKDHINTQQSFHLKYYVNNTVFNDFRIRDAIAKRSIEIIDLQLQNSQVSISDMIVALKNEFRESITGISLVGLGGENQLDVVSIDEPGAMLAIRKVLVQQEDGYLAVNEDIVIEFVDIEND